MAASQRPDSPDSKGMPQYPGSGQPRVPQPGQFLPNSPGRPSAQAPVSGAPKATQATSVPVRPASARLFDPFLLKEGAFEDRADYERTSKRIAALIKSGKIASRQPDGE